MGIPHAICGALAVTAHGHVRVTVDVLLTPEGLSSFPTSSGRARTSQPLFSHTSAIYVEVAGKLLFDRSAAEDLLREMDQSKDLIGTKALFADDPERAHVLGVYEQAMAILKKRLAGG